MKERPFAVLLSLFLVLILIAVALPATRTFALRKQLTTCPVLKTRAGCQGPWPINIRSKGKDPKEDPNAVIARNKRKVADAINFFIKREAWGNSPFFQLRNGDPGMAFVEIGLKDNINPAFLVGMAGAETRMGTSGPSMQCGNPFGQPPTGNNPVCTAKDGSQWYEYNKQHAITEDMLDDQAKRIWYRYVNDPRVENLDDFLNEYTPLDKNPDRDKSLAGCPKDNSGLRCGMRDIYLDALNDIKTLSQGVMVCSLNGTGGGDLANADALTEKGIECVLNATGHGQNLLPYAQQISDATHEFNVNPLFALAMFNKDSSLGTAGAGRDNKNPGNIGCRGDNYAQAGLTAGCPSRFASFNTYGDGAQAYAWLIRAEYIDKGIDTIDKIIPVYAPPSENDTAQYIKDVKDFMDKYGATCAN